MKVGSVEGTREEIRGFYEDNGLDLSDILEKPKKPLKRRWLIIPAVAFFLCFAILSLIPDLPTNFNIFIFLLGCCFILWLSVSSHILFELSVPITSIMIVLGILVLMVASYIITPHELLNYFREVPK